jgi:hypothetical protein
LKDTTLKSSCVICREKVALPSHLANRQGVEVKQVRLVSLAEVQPGAKLAKSVVTEDGRVLLPSGVELTEAFIRSLKAYRIESVFIAEPLTPTGSTYEVVSQETRRDLAREMKQAMSEITVTFSAASRGLKFPPTALLNPRCSRRSSSGSPRFPWGCS